MTTSNTTKDHKYCLLVIGTHPARATRLGMGAAPYELDAEP